MGSRRWFGRENMEEFPELIEGAQRDMRISRGIVEEIQAGSKNGPFWGDWMTLGPL